MNEHITVFREVVDRLMVEVNSIDRVIPEMLSTYPNWDLQDTTDFRDIVIANLNEAIARLNQI